LAHQAPSVVGRRDPMRGDQARLADILERIDRSLDYASPKNRQNLEAPLILDAIVRNLEVIGEAARELSPTLRKKYPELPWRAMIGFRVLATHSYWEVDPERVWAIVRGLPELRTKLARIQTAD